MKAEDFQDAISSLKICWCLEASPSGTDYLGNSGTQRGTLAAAKQELRLQDIEFPRLVCTLKGWLGWLHDCSNQHVSVEVEVTAEPCSPWRLNLATVSCKSARAPAMPSASLFQSFLRPTVEFSNIRQIQNFHQRHFCASRKKSPRIFGAK